MVSRCWWCYCKSLYQIEGWEADWNLITICASLLDSSWKRHLWCYQSGMIKGIDWKYSTNLRENTTKSTGLFFPNIGGVITKTFQQLPEWFPTFIVHHLRHSLPQGVMNVWGDECRGDECRTICQNNHGKIRQNFPKRLSKPQLSTWTFPSMCPCGLNWSSVVLFWLILLTLRCPTNGDEC